MENLVPVTLVIKAPNQKIADQTVECALNWTVKKLKEHLASVYPSQPKERQQRIIYSGKLLLDDVTLKDVLRQYEPNQTIHTVHLVCSPSTTDASDILTTTSPSVSAHSVSEGLRQRHVANTTAQSSPATDTQHTSYVAFNPTATGQYNPLMYTNAATMMPGPAGMMPGPAGMMPGPAGMMPGAYSMEQMMWMQQAYVQYMAQYMQYYQAGSTAAVPPVVDAGLAIHEPANIQPANPPVAAAAANGVPRPGQQPIRMNAQGGPVADDDDDDQVNRDWLDWVYTFIRFSMLLCILYFYSSLGRFLATLGFVALVYLYQAGFFQLNRRDPVQQVPPPQPQPPAANQEAPANQQPADDQQAAAAGEEQPTIEVAAQVQRGTLSLAWSFFVSFFTSLAPQPPPAINAN